MVSRLPPLGDGGVVVWATTQNLLAVTSTALGDSPGWSWAVRAGLGFMVPMPHKGLRCPGGTCWPLQGRMGKGRGGHRPSPSQLSCAEASEVRLAPGSPDARGRRHGIASLQKIAGPSVPARSVQERVVPGAVGDLSRVMGGVAVRRRHERPSFRCGRS